MGPISCFKERMIARWTKRTFPKEELYTPRICALRVLEEAAEIAQAEGVSFDDMCRVLVQVDKRPVGDPREELGGLMIVASQYASVKGELLEERWWAEFRRIDTPEMMEKILNRQKEKVS